MAFGQSLQLTEVTIRGEKYSMIGFSSNPSVYRQWNVATQDHRIAADPGYSPRAIDPINDFTELPITQRILFQGEPLLESADMKAFLAAEGTRWSPYSGDPLASLEEMRAFNQNFFDLLLEFSYHQKDKFYGERGAVPDVISDFYQSSQHSGLRAGTYLILVLDGSKNFVGLFSLSYPTVENPLLPAQEILEELKARGRADSKLKFPLIHNYETAMRIRDAGTINPSDGSFQKYFPFVPSLTVELGSLVKNPNLKFDIFPWAIFLFETTQASLPEEGRLGLRPNGVESTVGEYPYKPGQYISVTRENRLPLFLRAGWQPYAQVGDAVFSILSREKYLANYFDHRERRQVDSNFAEESREARIWGQYYFGRMPGLHPAIKTRPQIPMVPMQEMMRRLHLAFERGRGPSLGIRCGDLY